MIRNSYRNQYFTTLCVNLGTIAYAMASGWMSPIFSILLSTDCPLENGPLTLYEVSWVASCLTLGGATGALFSGWSSNRFGRKIALIIAGTPQLISWLFIYFGWNANFLYISRLMAGFAGGTLFAILPVYISEISEDKIRGALGSYLTLTNNVGILIGYLVGAYLDYFIVPLIGLIFSILFLCGFIFILPETPQYLLVKNRITNAEKSLGFFRNIRRLSQQEKSLEFVEEMKKLQRECSFNNMAGCGGGSSCSKIDENKFQWSSLWIPSTKRGLMIGITILSLNQLCGLFAILNYTAYIFDEAGSDLDPNICAIIIAFIHLCGAYLSTLLVDRIGRKILILYSAVGSGISLTVLGIYFFMKSYEFNVSSFNWLPILSLSSFVFLACLGIIPIGFIIAAEILPQNIRGPFLSYFQVIVWTIGFLGSKYFAIVSENYGMQYCFGFFAFWCYLDAFIIGMLMPETKGKSIEEIINLLGSYNK